MCQCCLFANLLRTNAHASNLSKPASSAPLLPSASSPLSPASSAIFETLPENCLALIFSFVLPHHICSLLTRVCWRWNGVVCRNFGYDYIRKWSDPNNTRLGGGMLILRPLCAAVSLLPSMEHWGLKVETEDKIQLLSVRYENAWNMHMNQLAESDAREIMRLSPSSAAGHLYMGNLYARKGHHEKARREYALAIEIEPNNEVATNKMNDLGQQQRVHNIAEWVARLSTIKRLLLVLVIVVFVILFIVQGLRLF
eukprot:Phypoly_transcript_14963.p1 GENE.Phypoly_transcript_14963~~Phypoly_transcript_14963.p1  ORF type:complete len:254 (+),score=34.43 Phypoly_transcript_14963:164-925(+)